MKCFMETLYQKELIICNHKKEVRETLITTALLEKLKLSLQFKFVLSI